MVLTDRRVSRDFTMVFRFYYFHLFNHRSTEGFLFVPTFFSRLFSKARRTGSLFYPIYLSYVSRLYGRPVIGFINCWSACANRFFGLEGTLCFIVFFYCFYHQYYSVFRSYHWSDFSDWYDVDDRSHSCDLGRHFHFCLTATGRKCDRT